MEEIQASPEGRDSLFLLPLSAITTGHGSFLATDENSQNSIFCLYNSHVPIGGVRRAPSSNSYLLAEGSDVNYSTDWGFPTLLLWEVHNCGGGANTTCTLSSGTLRSGFSALGFEWHKCPAGPSSAVQQTFLTFSRMYNLTADFALSNFKTSKSFTECGSRWLRMKSLPKLSTLWWP